MDKVFLPIMEDDSLGNHGIMKILCNPHFIEYKVIKQKVSQLPLPWEVLMMRCSMCHGCCLNGESVLLSVSMQELTLLTRGSLEVLPHLGGEETSLEQKITFFFSCRQIRRKMNNLEQCKNYICIHNRYLRD